MRYSRDPWNTGFRISVTALCSLGLTYGSAINRSVSLMILFGSAMVTVGLDDQISDQSCCVSCTRQRSAGLQVGRQREQAFEVRVSSGALSKKVMTSGRAGSTVIPYLVRQVRMIERQRYVDDALYSDYNHEAQMTWGKHLLRCAAISVDVVPTQSHLGRGEHSLVARRQLYLAACSTLLLRWSL